MIEIGDALGRNFRQQATEIIRHFLSSGDVEIVRLDAKLFAEGFALFQMGNDKEWGMTDCISFAAMRRAGIRDVLTFDRHFIQAGFQALMRVQESK